MRRVRLRDGGLDRTAEGMLGRMLAGEVRALARAITLIEAGGTEAEALVAGCRRTITERGGERALRIGVTGAPGVGKSTLVDRMVGVLRGEGRRVGVVAVDPTSPYTGGALLGDRIRMQAFGGDEGVYVRSMASRRASGGVGAATEGACLAMEAAGRDVVIVETVGVGQDGVGVCGVVDVVVVVLVPGMGDEVQAMKAGILEVADVFAVNKADMGGAEGVEAELVAMQGLGEGRVRAVVRTVGRTGEGVGELMVKVRAQGIGLRAQEGRVRVVRAQGLGLWAQEGSAEEGANTVVLDHLGVAVQSLEGVRGFYEGIGLRVRGVETVEHEGVRVMMMSVGESRIELLEALGEETTIGRFVARRGEGLHHVALRVAGIDAMFARMVRDGVRVVGDGVKVGAGGHRYFFVHPASTGGVLVEMVEV